MFKSMHLYNINEVFWHPSHLKTLLDGYNMYMQLAQPTYPLQIGVMGTLET